MPIRDRTPDQAADVIAASHRELVAAATALDAYVVRAADCPQHVRDEAARVHRSVAAEAALLGELLPTMRRRADTPKAAKQRAAALGSGARSLADTPILGHAALRDG
jgi:hypothetical protein